MSENYQIKWYGILEENQNIFFAIDDFYCVFMNISEKNGEISNIVQHEGFVVGKILGGTKTKDFVYIYIGEDIQVQGNHDVNTWLYITSNCLKLNKFQTITFKGGILNKLLHHSQWDIPKRENGTLSISTNLAKNNLTYSLHNKKIEGNISVRAGIRESMSLERGSSLTTVPTELEVSFKTEKGLGFFTEIYGYIMNLCQFMVFRKNICFEEILLQSSHEEFLGFNGAYATCHIKTEGNAETAKGLLQCITFNSLGEQVDNLLNYIIESKEKRSYFNIGFLPQEDRDVRLFTSMRIRETISALETELNANGIESQMDEEFNHLIESLKKVVKEHRAGDKPLNNSEDYDYIFGSLEQMKRSLAGRTQKFVEDYNYLNNSRWIGKAQIKDLVKYRNEITHGNFLPINQELADTAYMLMELIYCSILKRVGVKDDVIKNLMRRHVLS